MKIIYVQTYPLYHDGISVDQWLLLENRDKWMPEITASIGHDVEIWGGGFEENTFTRKSDNSPDIIIRSFKTDRNYKKSRNRISRDLCAALKAAKPDLCILKGMDGGIGTYLAKKVLIPNQIPFAIIIGGTVYHGIANHALAICYETDHQKKLLLEKRPFFGKPITEDQLIKLPKSVDTDLFYPHKDIEQEFDVIAMGRLISYYKNYDALGALSKHCKVAVIGGGEKLDDFRKDHPQITWLGPVPHNQVPQYLAKGRIFFHTGLRDYFPRVIPEAAACGLPVIGFSSIIKKDVIPEQIGMRVSGEDFIDDILSLLRNPGQQKKMAKEARDYATTHWHKHSLLPVIEELLSGLDVE